MMRYRVTNITSGRVLGDQICLATGLCRRLRGLMWQRNLSSGGGLWLQPCQRIHTYGMRFAIDVAFVDLTGRVVCLLPGLPPGRVSSRIRAAAACLELPAGTLKGTDTAVADRLKCEPAEV